MTKHHININANDPTASKGFSKKDLKDAVQYAVQQQQHQIKQRAQNAVYGQSVMTSQAQEVFKKHIEEALSRFNRFKEIEGRDYEQIQDTLYEAMHHVRNEGGRREDYVWVINPDTLMLIRDLYDFFSRATTGISQETTMEMMGVAFFESPNVPEGWVLLANKDRLATSNGYRPTPHPMALIREIDAGFQECVDMDIGGEMYFRVINA